jgi:hypothetical protein
MNVLATLSFCLMAQILLLSKSTSWQTYVLLQIVAQPLAQRCFYGSVLSGDGVAASCNIVINAVDKVLHSSVQ